MFIAKAIILSEHLRINIQCCGFNKNFGVAYKGVICKPQ